jgi:hypothetical protein
VKPASDSYLLRFFASALIVGAASSPYLFSGALRSSAAGPWLWAFIIEARLSVPVLPTAPVILFLASAGLLAVCATWRVTWIVGTGWCAVNAVAAYIINFHLYARN